LDLPQVRKKLLLDTVMQVWDVAVMQINPVPFLSEN
jgi:hypothetical protein